MAWIPGSCREHFANHPFLILDRRTPICRVVLVAYFPMKQRYKTCFPDFLLTIPCVDIFNNKYCSVATVLRDGGGWLYMTHLHREP